MKFNPGRLDSVSEMRSVVFWLIVNYANANYPHVTHKIVYKPIDAGWISILPLPSDESRQKVVDSEYLEEQPARHCTAF